MLLSDVETDKEVKGPAAELRKDLQQDRGPLLTGIETDKRTGGCY